MVDTMADAGWRVERAPFEYPAPTPDGSVRIEDLFESYDTWAGVPHDDTAVSGRSDYQAFVNRGVPSSGLFTGAEVVKTEEQAGIWGGTAGDYDYDYDNDNDEALDTNADAMAFRRADLRLVDRGRQWRAGTPGAGPVPQTRSG